VQLDSRTFFNDNPLSYGNDSFVLRRARPIIEGTVFRDFDFQFVPDFGGSSVQIFDANLNYRLSPELQLRAGKFKGPAGFENLQSDATLPFNERSLVSDLVPARSIGVQLAGDIADGAVSYAAGVFNGSGDGRNPGTADFSDVLTRVKATKPDILVAASIRLQDLVTITRQMREVDLNVGMFSAVPYGLLPDYYKQLGKEAEFVYSGSFWETGLPYPGNREFVAAYEKEFNRAPAVQSAGVGVIAVTFVALMGAGVAEASGLMAALIRLLVAASPRRILAFALILVGVLSSIATDAGYLILVPLGAAAFASVGRHPLAGMAACFAGVGAIFGVNPIPGPIDAQITAITNEALAAVGGQTPLTILANYWFSIVSSIVIALVAYFITERVVEPRPAVGRVPDPASGAVRRPARRDLARYPHGAVALGRAPAPVAVEILRAIDARRDVPRAR
jgi:hypothetical protein